jgi:hypothetical protein
LRNSAQTDKASNCCFIITGLKASTGHLSSIGLIESGGDFLNSVGKKSKKPMISGIVIPDQWDANGKVITVTIHANDEKVFLVEHTKIGNDLLNLIHKEVEVTGKIRERFDGKTSIGIKSYKTADRNGLDMEG